MRKRISAFCLMLALSGCYYGLSPASQAAGLNEGILFELEAEDWGKGYGELSWPEVAKRMKVPLDARAIRIWDVTCTKIRGVESSFKCSYRVDWGRAGRIEGTYRRNDVTLGHNDKGEWSNDIIIVTGS